MVNKFISSTDSNEARMVNKFISSTDSNEARMVNTESDNSEVMTGNDTDEIITEHFNYLFRRYHIGIEG